MAHRKLVQRVRLTDCFCCLNEHKLTDFAEKSLWIMTDKTCFTIWYAFSGQLWSLRVETACASLFLVTFVPWWPNLSNSLQTHTQELRKQRQAVSSHLGCPVVQTGISCWVVLSTWLFNSSFVVNGFSWALTHAAETFTLCDHSPYVHSYASTPLTGLPGHCHRHKSIRILTLRYFSFHTVYTTKQSSQSTAHREEFLFLISFQVSLNVP